MEDIIQKLTADGKFQLTTATTYARFVKNLVAKDVPFKNTMVKDTKAVMAAVAEYAPSTQISILNALYRVVSVLPKSYAPFAKKYQDEMKKRIAAKEPVEGKTAKQEENWVTWDEVIKKRDEVTGVDKVILSLYTMLPPGRVQEYATMGVNEGENRYDTTKKQFVIGKHKTAGRTGEVTIEVPEELVKVLAVWLDGRKSGLLLNGLTAPSITKHLNKVFGKKVGPSALRHIYVTERFGDVGKEMKETAKMMRHSVGTQQGTYNVA